MSEIPRGGNTVQFRFAILASALVAGLVLSALPAKADITHTTSNLNLRAGPGTHHKVKAIIPAGAAIDIETAPSSTSAACAPGATLRAISAKCSDMTSALAVGMTRAAAARRSGQTAPKR